MPNQRDARCAEVRWLRLTRPPSWLARDHSMCTMAQHVGGLLCRYGQQGPEEQENQSRPQARYQGAEERHVHSPRRPLQSILNDPTTVTPVSVSHLRNNRSVARVSDAVNSGLAIANQRWVIRSRRSRKELHVKQACASPNRCQAESPHTCPPTGIPEGVFRAGCLFETFRIVMAWLRLTILFKKIDLPLTRTSSALQTPERMVDARSSVETTRTNPRQVG